MIEEQQPLKLKYLASYNWMMHSISPKHLTEEPTLGNIKLGTIQKSYPFVPNYIPNAET